MSNEIQSFEATQAVVSAEVDQQIKTAKMYPRDLKQFFSNGETLVSQSIETAESCIYCLPRGGKEIKGPSVRLAEIVASAYGNLHCATRLIGQDARTVTAQAVAWDLENNVKITTEVKRSIIDKYGKPYKSDMINMTGSAAASIALRNAIFKVIPRAFVDPIYQKAVEVAVGKATSINARRTKMFEVFAKMGVTKDKILKFLEHNDEVEITREDIETLIGIRNALKDGAAKIEDYFAEEVKKTTPTKENASETEKKAADLRDKL